MKLIKPKFTYILTILKFSLNFLSFCKFKLKKYITFINVLTRRNESLFMNDNGNELLIKM